eukprot:1139345-Pelagomonas_calceolata.AAC.3
MQCSSVWQKGERWKGPVELASSTFSGDAFRNFKLTQTRYTVYERGQELAQDSGILAEIPSCHGARGAYKNVLSVVKKELKECTESYRKKMFVIYCTLVCAHPSAASHTAQTVAPAGSFLLQAEGTSSGA